MRYQTAAGFRTALEDRLRTVANQHGQLALTRQRKLVVFDRLIARLLTVAPERWIIKGGIALDLRLGERARTTKDLDIARRDDEDAATEDLLAAQTVDLGDHFTFTIERTDHLDVATDGAAVRFRATAALAGRRFDAVIIDIGFDDPPVNEPDMLIGPTFLAFAGIEPITIPALPLEQHIAEKVHAYTRTYGGSRDSTRVKDLVDLVIMRSAAEYRAGRLRSALESTFEIRGSHSLPLSLPAPPANWVLPYRTLATELGIDPSVTIGHQRSEIFLNPILAGHTAPDALWDDAHDRWKSAEV